MLRQTIARAALPACFVAAVVTAAPTGVVAGPGRPMNSERRVQEATLSPQSSETAPEKLHYRWRLGGLLGGFARMFLPGQGSGSLTTRDTGPSRREVELQITADSASEDEFWRYGSEVDLDDERTLRAWSAYNFRGKARDDKEDLEQAAVVDIASGIDLLRRRRPREDLELRIWSDGKVYPIVIEYRGAQQWRSGGATQPAHFYAIRPRKVTGERLWKGRMDIHLAIDAEATPLEIVVERKFARVRLVLEEEPPA